MLHVFFAQYPVVFLVWPSGQTIVLHPAFGVQQAVPADWPGDPPFLPISL
jgi:hypothetical protein